MIVPALTYIAVANAVRYVGGEVVLVDVDPHTWCLDPHQIEAAISPKTKGIVAVHLYGHPADMDTICQIADKHKFWVVEDAAEAPFATYKARPTGGLATIGTFSFYGNKIVTCGEGGAITFNDSSLDKRARMWVPAWIRSVAITTRSSVTTSANESSLLDLVRAIGAPNGVDRRPKRDLQTLPASAFQSARHRIAAREGRVEISAWLFCALVDSGSFGCSRGTRS